MVDHASELRLHHLDAHIIVRPDDEDPDRVTIEITDRNVVDNEVSPELRQAALKYTLRVLSVWRKLVYEQVKKEEK